MNGDLLTCQPFKPANADCNVNGLPFVNKVEISPLDTVFECHRSLYYLFFESNGKDKRQRPLFCMQVVAAAAALLFYLSSDKAAAPLLFLPNSGFQVAGAQLWKQKTACAIGHIAGEYK